MFERDPVLSSSFSEYPRQCVPVAVVMYNRAGSLNDAVDLRLVADDHPRCSRINPQLSTDRGGESDVSVVVGQAGRRRVVVGRSEKAIVGSVSAETTSDHQQTSHRTVMFCPSGMIKKITINNDRDESDTAAPTVDHGNISAPHVSSLVATSSLLSPSDDIKTTVLRSSTKTAAEAAEAPVGNKRSQYSHLIRRRKKTQSAISSPHPVSRATADLPSPPLPRADDTPLTLLQHQKTLVGCIAKQLSVELSTVTSFLRVTKPAHIDNRERVAIQSMQRINGAFQRLTSACLPYRRFCDSTCADVAETALPNVDALRKYDSTLRRCRNKLASSFNERRDVILQTPIAGQQRLFTFVWLQRHSTEIIQCIDVVVNVLKDVLSPPTSSVQTSSSAGQPATSNPVGHHEMTGGHDLALNVDEVKPDISRLDDERVQTAGTRLGNDEAQLPLLTPVMKTDIVPPADEPPVLQPCVYQCLDKTPDNDRSLRPPSVTDDDRRCLNASETRPVNSSSPDYRAASRTRSVAIKQEEQEDISTVQSSTLLDTVPADACESLDRSQLAGYCPRNGIVIDTSGQLRIWSKCRKYYVAM